MHDAMVDCVLSLLHSFIIPSVCLARVLDVLFLLPQNKISLLAVVFTSSLINDRGWMEWAEELLKDRESLSHEYEFKPSSSESE